MSIRAAAYRELASAVRRTYALSDDEAVVAAAAGLERAYEALAQTEEWLEAEAPPCAV
jgi:hypothetical protein